MLAAQGARPRGRRLDRGPARPAPRAGGDAARLPAPGRDLAGRADRRRARRLPRRRHGTRQDGHPDRAAPAPSRPKARVRVRHWWSARRRCSATGRPRSGGSRRASPVRRFHGAAARPRTEGSTDGVRAHDVRHDAPRPRDAGDGALGPGGRRRGPARQERHAPPPRATCARSARGPGRAHRHAGGEPPHRALGDPRLGHARAARLARGVPQGVGRADRVGGGPGQGAPVRAAGRAVPDAATQVRPRHRARAAAEDRDRPGRGADPGAGGPLRGSGPGVDGADRARRRGQPGAGSCSPSSPA